MAEQSERLHELLEQLHRELESADDLHADTEAELRGAMQDIRTALAARAEEDAAEEEAVNDAAHHHGLFSDAAREFSASHPVLARTIGQLADILGQAGI